MKEGSRITKSEENKKCSCFPYCMRIAVFCMVMLVSVVTLIPHAVYAEERNCTFINSNVNRQNYIVWSQCVKSYLGEEQGGYYRVQVIADEDILVDHYSGEWQYISQQWIQRELPIFGGFYEGKNAFFCVFGQQNWEESDEKEVVRVVKYDKQWRRIGAASLYGANTVNPFEAGSLRMTEVNDKLYVQTCHKMYKTKDDGLNHQANMFFVVDEIKMSVEHASYRVSDDYGYVGHSFNQYIQSDGEYIYRLDHGDAYPRKMVLTKTKIEEIGKGDVEAVSMLDIAGQAGNNSTGASAGGLEYTSMGCLTAGNSIIQDGNHTTADTRNIYVTYIPKDEIKLTERKEQSGSWTMIYKSAEFENTKFQWLTDYSASSSVSPSTPHLVKINDNSFLVLWNLIVQDEKAGNDNEPNGQFCYVFLDGSGNKVSDIRTEKGMISDCKPIVSNGAVLWYVSTNEKLLFCKISADGSFQQNEAVFPENVEVYPKHIKQCKGIAAGIGQFRFENEEDSYHLVDGNKVLKRDINYKTMVHRFINGMVSRVYAKGLAPYYYGRAEINVGEIRKKSVIRVVKRTKKGVTVYWKKEPGAMGYIIYKQTANGKREQVKKIENAETVSWSDESGMTSKQTVYYLKAYTLDKNNNVIFTALSSPKGVLKKSGIIYAKYKGGILKVKCKKIKYKDFYQVQYSSKRKKINKGKKFYTYSNTAQKRTKLGKTCYIRVRACAKYTDGKKTRYVYGEWSNVKKVKRK